MSRARGGRSRRGGCSVTGGLVYRGSRIPSLSGTYFFADYCQGWIRSFRWVGGEATEVREWTDELGRPGRVSSFGEDAVGELYVVVHVGRVHRVLGAGNGTEAGVPQAPQVLPSAFS